MQSAQVLAPTSALGLGCPPNRVSANAPTPCSVSLRDLDEVFGFQTGGFGDSKQQTATPQEPNVLDAFLDDEMFNTLFDASDLERMLDQGNGLQEIDQPGTIGSLSGLTAAPYACAYKSSSLPSRTSEAAHYQQGIMMPVYADAYAPSQARKRAHEAACSPASAVSSAAPYKVYRGQARRIRLVGPALLHIQPQLLNIFGFVPATCSALPGHCTCTPGGLRCSAPLPPATVAFDSPQLGDEELVYILATLQHRQRAMLDPDYDQRRPLPDGLPMPASLHPRDADGKILLGPMVYTEGREHNRGRLYFASFNMNSRVIKRFMWADGLDPFSEQARKRGERYEAKRARVDDVSPGDGN